MLPGCKPISEVFYSIWEEMGELFLDFFLTEVHTAKGHFEIPNPNNPKPQTSTHPFLISLRGVLFSSFLIFGSIQSFFFAALLGLISHGDYSARREKGLPWLQTIDLLR